jgi:glycosyltransferase involved in cell wall biosynthesis
VRVGVDGRSLAGSRGVAHYTSLLLQTLAERHPEDEWALFVSEAVSADRLAALTAAGNVRPCRHWVPSRVLFGAAALAGAPRIDRLLGGGLDVVWAPAPRPLALSAGVPLVLTVHDLSFEERPGDFTAYERLWHRLARPRRLTARASRVMVDAAVTRRALAERWGVAPARTAVVAPGVVRPARTPDPQTIEAMRRRRGLRRPYLLAVGALEPRKDPHLLVRAHARAVAEGLAADVVFAGEGRLAPRLRGPGVHVLGYVPDAELDVLYAGAVALVMPSRLEGFGWPPLDAIVRGTPAIVADLPVYDETLGDGALRVPVGDESALAAALVRIASDASLRERLVVAGRAAIEPLTWERAAAGAHAVLSQAAGA